MKYANRLISFTQNDIPSEVITLLIKVLEDHLKSKYDNWEDRIEDLEQLAIYAQNYPSIQKLLETLSLNYSNLESKTVLVGDQTEVEKPLILSTIHRAKGLEWRVVFIPMLCEDAFPSGRVIGDPDGFEEERRVFYVAITRTKDQLYLISPVIRQTYRGPQTVRVSQFVAELDSKVYKHSTVNFKPSKSGNKNNFPLFRSAADL
jgi:DNA helicase-2/ATP-dependent DNA helicase PcrA